MHSPAGIEILVVEQTLGSKKGWKAQPGQDIQHEDL
jgi:hypothetical protein